jgi:hypothetical protein
MRIGPTNEPEASKKRPPPPNFQSRAMQIRMFLLLALLFLVIGAISEARKPERWQWLWKLNATVEEEPIDSKLSPPAPPKAVDPESMVMKMEAPALPNGVNLAEEDPATTQQRAWESAWKTLDGSLSNQDRRILFELLRNVPPDDVETWSASVTEMLTRLDEAWDSYLLSSRSALADLSPAEQVAWKHVLDQLGERWKRELQPLLAARGKGESTDAQVSQAFHTLLTSIALANVQDDTPWRGAEREIWFHLFDQLQKQSADDLKRESPGFVSYSQLFKQSKSYRGKLVTVRGEAVAVYPESAAKNKYGIEQYWVYWLYPHGGPASPMLVYALQKPADFPSFSAADMGHKKLASREDIEFTGYFFKRYAYQGQGGIYTAPTLVAVEPQWLQSEKVATAPLPSVGVALMTILVLAALAALFAAWVYMQYRPGGLREHNLPAHLPNIQDEA